MTDLVKRLRARADHIEFNLDPEQATEHWLAVAEVVGALREAADALETATIQRRVANLNNEGNLARAEKAEAEADALKVKLAEAEQGRRAGWAEHWYQKHDEARAEAAALRDALYFIGHSNEHPMEFVDIARRALSEPGPGAALLERVKKLEAVAEAARFHYIVEEKP